MYADDTNVFTTGRDVNKSKIRMNRGLARMNESLKDNALTLNVKKSCYMVFHRARRKLTESNINAKIGDVVIAQVESIRFLGIILDENCS